MNEEEKLFAEKARNYVVCMVSDCALSDHCLRHRLSQYVPTSKHLVTCINPRWEKRRADQCSQYRDDRKVRMAVGMMHMLDRLPALVVLPVRKALIAQFSRTGYYAMRKGERLITPADQELITEVFRSHGIDEAPQYDGFVDDYWW